MNKLQKDFLRQSIADLEDLSVDLRDKKFSENVLRGAFRLLHTIKGTAQVFGFSAIGNLTHEIENLLQKEREQKIAADENFHSLLGEGLDCLTETLRNKHASEKTVFPKTFVEKLRLATKSDSTPKNFSLYLPPEIESKLSKSEKDLLGAAFENEKNLFLIEAAFQILSFETEFKNFRSVLSEAGEIAAVFPASNSSGQIGFRFFLATEKFLEEIFRIVEPFKAQINFKLENANPFADNLGNLLLQAVNGAKKVAEQSGKEIEFDVSFSDAEIPARTLKILFDALLHLTRNAVDHAVEQKGKITILLTSNENGFLLTVTDNGRGVDFEKLRAKAIEKKLIAEDTELDENEILNLIFVPGVSTRPKVSDTSGRGVGLDAVKTLVEAANGKINVSSRSGRGTSFEVFLPREK